MKINKCTRCAAKEELLLRRPARLIPSTLAVHARTREIRARRKARTNQVPVCCCIVGVWSGKMAHGWCSFVCFVGWPRVPRCHVMELLFELSISIKISERTMAPTPKAEAKFHSSRRGLDSSAPLAAVALISWMLRHRRPLRPPPTQQRIHQHQHVLPLILIHLILLILLLPIPG